MRERQPAQRLPQRELVTSAGTIDLRIPKPRAGSYFPEDLIERSSRVDRAVIAAASEVATNDVSTRKVKRVARTMGIDRMSASQVSRMCSSLDEAVADLQERDPSDPIYPYIWLDATCIKRRGAGRVRSTAPITAIGTESHDGWKSFLLSPRARGVDGAACVTGDAHEGLRRAIREVFPGAVWQRRIAHLMRNAAANAPTRQKKGAVPGILKAVLAERDPEFVWELYQLATAQIEGFCPKPAEVLEEAEADALAYLDFPYEHHVRPRTNNVQERASRELKRRSRVVQACPGRKPLIRMMGAVFSEIDED